jgi:peroxiredoxin
MELLRDRRAEFEEAGVEPIGLSRDSAWTHVAWHQTLDLNFGLVSDYNGDATRGFDVAFEFRGLKDVSERTAFLLDEEAVVRGAWHYETGEVPDVDELLAAARDLARSRPQ